MRSIFKSSQNGFALVLVLMLVALMTILVLAIFMRVGTESKMSSASSSGQIAQQLADLAVQVVKSQVQKATTQTAAQGKTVSWASQPGMIRCYDSSGNEVEWFKLYSASSMTTVPSGNQATLITADLPTTGWQDQNSTNYGVFTDINSPIYSADGSTLLYPVVDPSGAKSLATSSTDVIAGFDVNTADVPGYSNGTAASASNNPVAMPVRWLYVLEDGSLVPGQATNTPGEVRVPGASNNNRIIGRVAFWTDDESCKLNVNTAADGTYFDSPRFNSKQATTPATTDAQRFIDRQFAYAPPVAGEFPRYIGHPAQTRLSVVLPSLANLDLAQRSNVASNFSPFLRWGGSQGGSLGYYGSGSSTPLSDPQRPTLYASLDEWMFAVLPGNPNGRNPNVNSVTGSGTPLVSNQDLQRLHFFLTADSTAPEVNLFGQPRIAIWPIHNDYLTSGSTSVYTTALDRMVAKAATLNQANSVPSTYFFTRKDSTSPTYDYAGIPRNQALFGYLRNLTANNIPGYGNNFDNKYTQSGADQILTEIFDYIRSTNTSDPMLLTGTAATSFTYTTFRNETRKNDAGNPVQLMGMGQGQVVPIVLNDYKTKGFGRFPTVREVAVDFSYTGTTTDGTGRSQMVATMLVDMFSPSLGPMELQPCYLLTMNGLNSLTVTVTGTNGSSTTYPVFGLAPTGTSINQLWPGPSFSSRPFAVRWNGDSFTPFNWGGDLGVRWNYVGKDLQSYAFCSQPIPYQSTDTIQFQSGEITVGMYYPQDWGNGPSKSSILGGWHLTDGMAPNPAYLAQQLKLQFPSTPQLQAPKQAKYLMNERMSSAGYAQGSFNPNPGSGAYNPVPVEDGDVCRSMVVGGRYNGDLRLIGAQYQVPDGAFVKVPGYDTTQQMVHSLRDVFVDSGNNFMVSRGFVSPISQIGQLVAAANYSTAYWPIAGLINNGQANSPDSTGDWDNGLGILPDGPYINKPDEVGTQYFNYGNFPNYTYYYNGFYGSGTLSQSYSSPNRTVASPVEFGSLSTGVPVGGSAPAPWRTLLFRPQQNHFGETSPKDSLLLDWFWMPVVDPYAISASFATAGKVNMNYQLAPFTYIKRATAVIGVLGSEYVIAAPTSAGNVYKNQSPAITDYRFPVKVLESDNVTAADQDGSLRQFKETFDQGKIFRSAADICDIYLVPGASASSPAQSWSSNAQAEAYWASHGLTGDNTRERPYNGLYSRLTTKSNTYTVHVRAQALRNPFDTPAGIWRERPQYILSEYRGSVVIDRYLDPEDTNIPDFANSANFNKSIDSYYKYRLLESRRFLP